jgi:tetratricopeptide (TPR) repeat protein
VAINLVNLEGLSFSGFHIEVHVGGLRHETPVPLNLPLRSLTAAPTVLALLSWRTRTSEFAGRQPELLELTGWLEHPAPISLKLILGPAGSGKSRVGAEVARTLRGQKWNAGFFDLPCAKLVSRPIRQNTLLIIDYPEENPEGFAHLLRALSRTEATAKIRVLVLCRHLPAAWDDLLHTSGITDYYDQQPLTLGGLGAQAAYELYCTATETISSAFKTITTPVHSDLFQEWYERSQNHSNPLYVLAAAAHGSLYPEDPFLRYDGRQAVAALIRREQDRLRRLACGNGLHQQAYIDVVAIASIAGGLSTGQLRQAVGSFPTLRRILPQDSALAAMSRADERGDFHFDMPDIVSACFVAEALASSDSATELLWLAMSPNPAPLARFSRLAADAQTILGGTPTPIIKAAIDNLSIAERFEALARTYGVVQGSELDPVMWPLSEAIRERMVDQVDEPLLQIGALNNMGRMQSERGGNFEAIVTLGKALDLCRDTAASPEREREMALVQLNLGRAFVEVGQWAMGIGQLTEAIRAQHILLERYVGPKQSLQYWYARAPIWIAYDNLSAARAGLGDLAGAQADSEEALAVLNATRSFVEGPMTWTEHIVTTNLATVLAHRHQYQDALQILEIQEEALRKSHDDGGSPSLALTMNVLNHTSIVLKIADEKWDGSAPLDMEKCLAKANEALTWSDRLTAVSPERMWEFGKAARFNRLRFLEKIGSAEEVDYAYGETFQFLALHDEQDFTQLLTILYPLMNRLNARLDPREAARRLRTLCGDTPVFSSLYGMMAAPRG